jgi:hypothetical protein
MSEMKPIAMGNFFNSNRASPYAWVIQAITNSKWNHCGLVFILTDGKHENMIYFEALYSDGVEGPKQYTKIIRWLRKPFRSHEVIWLTRMTREEVETAYKKCEEAVKRRTPYGKAQLALILFKHLWGWPIPKDESHVICSEFMSRVDYPHFDLRTKECPNHDSVTPGSGYAKLKDKEVGYDGKVDVGRV